MSTVPCSNKLYLLTVTIVPQKKGINVPQLIIEISKKITDNSAGVQFIHKFKVSGEAKVVFFVEASDIIDLERLLGVLWELGPLDVDCQPIIPYESFAQNMKVADELCKPSSCGLKKEGIYWLEFNIEYHGQSFEDFLALWKKEAETVLTLRSKGESNLELFKSLAQRKVQVLLTSADPAQLDQLSLQLPIMQENGANIQIKSKSVQYLDDYVTRFYNKK